MNSESVDVLVRDGITGKTSIPLVRVRDLHQILNFEEKFPESDISREKPLTEWKMELDDAPIFRYIYRNFQPKRHLEFGTWQGKGALYCLEESAAAVWTLNLPFGECTSSGENSYGNYEHEAAELQVWAEKIGLPKQNFYQTDSIGFIGRSYLAANMGHRVCQIYCNSKEWDTSAYPEAFFDTVLIDGGHTPDVVKNDTVKAMPLLKSGGIMMWHDFCPPIWETFDCTRGVMEAIVENWEWLRENMQTLFWIQPSWILVGVKK